VEILIVDIWDKTSGSWDNLFLDLVADSWNNVTVGIYLIDDDEVTIRFRDVTVTGDTVQGTWLVDSVLLHSWE
jgi:hypothetical protein